MSQSPHAMGEYGAATGGLYVQLPVYLYHEMADAYFRYRHGLLIEAEDGIEPEDEYDEEERVGTELGAAQKPIDFLPAMGEKGSGYLSIQHLMELERRQSEKPPRGRALNTEDGEQGGGEADDEREEPGSDGTVETA